jgi:hypothetical protein
LAWLQSTNFSSNTINHVEEINAAATPTAASNLDSWQFTL